MNFAKNKKIGKNEKTLVLSVGGSLIVTAEGIDVNFLRRFRWFILKAIRGGHKFFLVVGGGLTARRYAQAAQDIVKVKAEARDWLGIGATRLNAQLLKTIFGDLVYPEIISDPNRKLRTAKPIVLAAGYKPGWSTDYDAVLLAKNNGIPTVVNLSNIDYAYDKDPRRFPGAKRLENVSWPDFRKVVGYKWRPGLNAPFDPIASREAAKNELAVVILNGQNIKNLQNYIQGKRFKGTVIS